MKGTLNKLDNGWMLLIDNVIYATDNDKLSLKNCQAIEKGYDLEELAIKHYLEEGNPYSFKEGFQKAMELMEGKKFSKYDMLDFAEFFMNLTDKSKPFQKLKDWESLQQTEWDVEIEMICPHPEDTYVCGMQYGCDEDGCNNPNQIPYLDKNGCLILKKI